MADSSTTLAPETAPTGRPSARRQALYRFRARRGEVCLTISVGRELIEALSDRRSEGDRELGNACADIIRSALVMRYQNKK